MRKWPVDTVGWASDGRGVLVDTGAAEMGAMKFDIVIQSVVQRVMKCAIGTQYCMRSSDAELRVMICAIGTQY